MTQFWTFTPPPPLLETGRPFTSEFGLVWR